MSIRNIFRKSKENEDGQKVDNNVARNGKKRVLIVSAAVIAVVCAALYLLSHSTYHGRATIFFQSNAYNDWVVIGSTAEEIEKIYGEFDAIDRGEEFYQPRSSIKRVDMKGYPLRTAYYAVSENWGGILVLYTISFNEQGVAEEVTMTAKEQPDEWYDKFIW